MIKELKNFLTEHYQEKGPFPLHRPYLSKKDEDSVLECIRSNCISSAGGAVDRFELNLKEYVGSKYCISVSNGTSGLHLSCVAVGVDGLSEVITQDLTFVGTCNANSYTGANIVTVDVDKNLCMCPRSLEKYLKESAIIKNGKTFNKYSGREIKACIPVHVFGAVAQMKKIIEICNAYNISIIEDAAESLGSSCSSKMSGTFGDLGVFSFNGNKIISTGGGGAIVTDNEILATKLKHLSTTAKKQHPYEYVHDAVGYNYRLPSISASLGISQLGIIENLIENKKNLHLKYLEFFNQFNVNLLTYPESQRPNYWLNSIILEDMSMKDKLIKEMNEYGILARPLWMLMSSLKIHDLKVFENKNSKYYFDRIINIPSSAQWLEY